MTTQPRISVIICAYTEKRWDALLAAITSVQRQRCAAWEIIVVIDHNQALFERACAQISDSVVIENRELRGLSGARNSGIARASGDIIAFLDDDAVAASDWLEQLLTRYTDANVLGVGGRILPAWETKRPAWFPEEFDWVVGCTYRGMPEANAPVRNLIGANMSFRRDVFQSIAGFRNGLGRINTLPMGCEETELCIQLHTLQPTSELIYCPMAVVNHHVPTSRGSWRYFCARCYGEGRSKALVSKLVGTKDGLASERSYTLRTLPKGMLNGLLDAIRGDVAGLARAGAIAAGLAITATGYATGMLVTIIDAQVQYPHAPLANEKSV